MTTRVDWVRLGSLADHERFLAASAEVQSERRSVERSLTRSTTEAFSVPGRCWVCRRDVELAVDYRWAAAGESGVEPNWREHLCCPSCGLNNRMRATVHFLEEHVGASRESRVYLTEQRTGLFGVMEARYPRLVSSEYLGEDVALGQLTASAIRNEDITRLSFSDALFDLIVTLDVLEHVPDTRNALAELRRVLRPGGSLVISVPFDPRRESHLVRAVVDARGDVQHLLPPEYHHDPVRPEGCLAFYRFGWQLLEDLRAAGFATADAYAFWSDAFGYLGSSSFLFLASVAPEATDAPDDLAMERFVPGHGGPGIELEHLHRYAFASTLARGRVLDLGCGVGYGTRMLSATPAVTAAVGVDVAPRAVAQSDAAAGPPVRAAVADALELPFAAETFDTVVSFELIEHVAGIERVLAEIARVVAPDGVMMLSTPNRPVYSDARSYNNPFHVRELDQGELRALLEPLFEDVELYGQELVAGSLARHISREGEGPGSRSHPVELQSALGAGIGSAGLATYFVAVCRRRKGRAEPLPSTSFLAGRLDPFVEEARLRWLEAQAVERRTYESTIEELAARLYDFDARIRRQGRDAIARQKRITELSQALAAAGVAVPAAGLDTTVEAPEERTRAGDAASPSPPAPGLAGEAARDAGPSPRGLEARSRGAPSHEALLGEVRFLEAQLAQLQVRERGASSELARVRVDLQWCYERLLEREAELSSIHSSKTWRLWMAYLALRRLVLRPVRWARRSVADAAKWLGSAALRALGLIHLLFWTAGAWMAAALRHPAGGGVAGAELPAAPSTDLRPRVLVVCPYSLHPPNHGGAVRILNLLRRLGATCHLQLLVFLEDDDDAEQRRALASLVEKLYVHRWRPQWRPDRLGLKPKAVQLFEAPEVRQRINEILAAESIDILQLEYTEMGQYGMPPFARVKVVLTEIDVAFRSLARRRRAGLHRRYRSSRMLGHSWADWARLFRYELKVVRRADQVHVMSEADAACLRRFLPGASGKIVVVPNGVDLEHYHPASPVASRERKLLFVGNFQHLPNVDALDHLVLEIWPIVRRLVPEAELLVVGARPPEEVLRHGGVPGVTVVGEVEDARPYYQTCRVLVAPIRAGSGTRLKILEALACGTPVVTTTLGAEGIEGSDGVHYLVRDAPERFAEAVCRVLADDALCDRLAEQGRRLVEERYGWDRTAAAVRAAYDRLLPARPAAGGAQAAQAVRDHSDAIDAPDVSVVIPTRQGGAGLARCLAAIGGQTTRRTVEVLCVDSGSSDADLRMMREHGARVVPVDGADFDHGLTRDLGARESRGRVLVFLNQDAVPADPRWLDRLTDPLFEPGGPAAVQGGILEVPESRQRFYWTSCGPRFYFTKESRRWIERYYGIGFSTVNAAIRREVWERHPFGRAPIMEDKKWQRDAVAAGHAIGLAPEASVYHTHDYAWRALLRRCYSEGIGWRLVGERYSFADMVTDLCRPEMLAELWRGMRRREVRTWAEALFPVLRPVMLFRGHRWGRTVRL